MTASDESEKQTALEAIRELLDGHFHEAVESAADDGTFSLGFRVKFSRSHVPTRVKVTCRVSKVMTDDSSGARKPVERSDDCPQGDAGARRQIETSADDPEQAKLPL